MRTIHDGSVTVTTTSSNVPHPRSGEHAWITLTIRAGGVEARVHLSFAEFGQLLATRPQEVPVELRVRA